MPCWGGVPVNWILEAQLQEDVLGWTKSEFRENKNMSRFFLSRHRRNSLGCIVVRETLTVVRKQRDSGLKQSASVSNSTMTRFHHSALTFPHLDAVNIPHCWCTPAYQQCKMCSCAANEGVTVWLKIVQLEGQCVTIIYL